MKQFESVLPNLLYGLEHIDEIISQRLLHRDEIMMNLSSRVNNDNYFRDVEKTLNASRVMFAISGFLSFMMTMAIFTVIPINTIQAMERSDYFTAFVIASSILITVIFLYPVTRYYYSMKNKLNLLYSNPLEINITYLEESGSIQNGKVLQINQLGGKFEIKYESSYVSSDKIITFTQIYTALDTSSLNPNLAIKVLVLNEYINIIL